MPVTTDRPQLLADAAISLIADGGIRALTHRAVDAAAGVPSGTTSYHFRTRRELLRGVLVRIAEVNAGRLSGLPGPPTDALDAPAARRDRLAEADQLANRVAVFIDGQLSERRAGTLARMACEIEVASPARWRGWRARSRWLRTRTYERSCTPAASSGRSRSEPSPGWVPSIRLVRRTA